MRINSISLRNIRSHKNTRISFQKGICVISGSNGSGKSTIAIAIEYALFGSNSKTRKNAVLRRGAKKGCITLEFEHNGKEYSVSRGLERKGDNIVLDKDTTGFYAGGKDILQIKRETDLNEKIVDALGYPEDKSRELFMITSYIRQEEIKKLIDMKDTERKSYIDGILNLAKYSIAWENMKDLLNEIGIMKKGYEGEISVKHDFLEQEKEASRQIESIEKEMLALKDAIGNSEDEFKNAKARFDEATLKKNALEKERESFRSAEKILGIKQESLLNKKKKIDMLKDEILKMPAGNSIEFNKSLSEHTSIRNNLSFLEESLEKLEDEYSFMEKIESSTCPLCKQKINPEHLGAIKKEFMQKKQDIMLKINDCKGSLEKSVINLEIAEKQKKNKELKEKAEHTIKNLEMDIKEIDKSLKEYEDVIKKGFDEKGLAEAEEQFSLSIENLSRKKAEHHSNLQKMEMLDRHKEEYSRRADELAAKLEQIKKIEGKFEWCSGVLAVLTRIRSDMRDISRVVRKKFMGNFRTEFQNRFEEIHKSQEYLVDLDMDYSPVIYDNEEPVGVSYLSGGERTSVALAYRLALADIASQLGGITKSEMLILDEPTENLDKESIRMLPEVFRSIKNLPQIILITHENELKESADYKYQLRKRFKVSEVI